MRLASGAQNEYVNNKYCQEESEVNMTAKPIMAFRPAAVESGG